MHEITIHFPNGLAPHVYNDVCAVLDGRPTARESSLTTDRNNCARSLVLVAADSGIPLERINDLLHSDGYDGNNYEAVASAVRQQFAMLR